MGKKNTTFLCIILSNSCILINNEVCNRYFVCWGWHVRKKNIKQYFSNTYILLNASILVYRYEFMSHKCVFLILHTKNKIITIMVVQLG